MFLIFAAVSEKVFVCEVEKIGDFLRKLKKLLWKLIEKHLKHFVGPCVMQKIIPEFLGDYLVFITCTILSLTFTVRLTWLMMTKNDENAPARKIQGVCFFGFYF
jgi:hypothetical protein